MLSERGTKDTSDACSAPFALHLSRSSDVCELIDGWVLEHIADVEVAAQGGVQTRRKTSGDQGIGALIEEVPDRIDMRNFHQIAQNGCDCLLEEVSRLPSRLR